MKKRISLLLIIALVAGTLSCKTGNMGGGKGEGHRQETGEQSAQKIVRKKRDDGTLSSVNPLDEEGYLHGVKVNYYEDGRTIHSKVTYQHGRKNGPAIWYYKSGKIFEHTTYYQNRKHGPSKKYYENGVLMEEVSFETGEELPGKKSYNRNGDLISD